MARTFLPPPERPAPKPGEVVEVESIPACDFCGDGTPGPYDFRTKLGPWANGCERHWIEMRAEPGLGVGIAQLWITRAGT